MSWMAGVQLLAGIRIFSSPQHPALDSIQLPIQYVLRGIKRPEHETDNSPPSSA
jgi:hypothetical protein